MFVRLQWMSIVLFVAASSILTTCGGDPPTKPGEDGTPVPTDTPTPEPTPSPSPLPGMSCGAPAVDGVTRCSLAPEPGGGVYHPNVQKAIDDLLVARPDLFDGVFVKDVGAYHTGVVRNLEVQGLCAIWDGEEVAVKMENSFSENYHVDTSSRRIRRTFDSYRATCRPAWFPVNPAPLPPRGDCDLPSSRDMGCDRLENPQFVDYMDLVAAEIARDRPDLVNGDLLIGTWNDYHDEYVTRLRAKGFCAIFDGHDVAVKKTNEFNEQYLVTFSSKRLRRGYDSYRATCTPATF